MNTSKVISILEECERFHRKKALTSAQLARTASGTASGVAYAESHTQHLLYARNIDAAIEELNQLVRSRQLEHRDGSDS